MNFFKKMQRISSTHCYLCKIPGQAALCQPCKDELPWLHSVCTRCALPVPDGQGLCGECFKKKPPYDRTIALFDYAPPIQGMISAFKFQSQLAYGKLLSQCLLERLHEVYEHTTLPEIIVPMPLHRSRLAERGYNQALELARPLASALRIALDIKHCQRVLATAPQSAQTAEERRHNLRGAFFIKKPFSAKHVAIVDDVITTASTVKELSHTLKASGVEKIEIWSIARTCLHG